MEKRIFSAMAFAAICLLAVCSCVKEQLPTGGFGRGYINPVVSLAGETTKSSGFPEGRYMGSCAMEGVGSDSLYISVYEYDNTDLPYGLMEEEPLTKGRVTTTESINATGQQFTLDAWLESENRYDGSQDGDGRVYITTDKDNWHIMDGVTVERGTSGWCYTSGLEYPWRNQVATNFWSVYPVSVSGRSITRPTDTATDAQQKALTFSYALPAACSSAPYKDAENQPDLCFAYNTKTWSDGDDDKINIQFHHALSAVYFRVENVIDGVTVRQIGFDDVLSSGVCDVTGNTDNTPSFEWRDRTQPEDYTQDYVHSTDFSDAKKTQPFTGNDKIYMMIPQTLGSGTKLRAQFKLSDNSIVTRTADFSKFSDGTSVEWKPGKKYLYKLSANAIDFDYTLSIDRDTVSVIAKNDCNWEPLHIASYKIKKGSTVKEPVQWFLNSYSLDNGMTWNTYDPLSPVPDTLLWNTPRGYFESGIGGDDNYVVMAPASARYEDHWTAYTTELRTRSLSLPHRGSDTAPWDLSTHDFKTGDVRAMCTANCYVVDRAGYYMLPLVYGPAIYNGAAVPQSYQEAFVARGTEYMTHLGTRIESPYIYNNNGCSPSAALLVYQDKENLIDPSSVSLTADHHYLKFKVNADGIEQGNAIVAVTDINSDIMWSWHIWVTAEDYTETHPISSETANGTAFTTEFSTLNLGTVRPPKEREYFGRELWLRFEQQESGRMDTVVVMQEPLIEKEITTNSLYQWGRKDPMLRANGAEATERHCYTSAGTDAGQYRYQVQSSAASSIAESIKNPNVFYASADWMSGSSPQLLWNNGLDPYEADFGYQIVKTLYDPCPVGFSVPSALSGKGLFKLHTMTSSTNSNDFEGAMTDEGFEANDDDKEHTILFNFSGYKISDGTMGGVGTTGQWWCSNRFGAYGTCSYPYTLAVYNSVQITLMANPSLLTGNAYSIRPAKY